MTGGWFKAPAAAWPSILDRLPRPLTADEVAVDLAWLRDREGFDGVRVPGRVELGRRWGLPKHRVSAILARAPDGRMMGAGRADDGRNSGAATTENADNRKISGRNSGAGRADDGRMMGAGRADPSGPIEGNAASGYTESSDGTEVAFIPQTTDLRQQTDEVGALAPEPAPTVPDDRPSHPALPPVGATADGRPGDGEGFLFAHAPTPPAALRGSDASGGGGEPAKARKKRAPAGPSPADLDAWSDCVGLWRQVNTKARPLNAEAGAGRSLAEAIGKIGSRRMLARLTGATVDAWVAKILAGDDPLTLVAFCREKSEMCDRLEALGEEILSAREASAPIDWRATLDRWVQAPDTHPGLAEPSLWTTLRAAAIAQGARGDAPTVLRWLADATNRNATLAALTEPEKPAAPAGPRVRTWDEVLEACRTQGSAGLTVAEYGVVTDVGRAADGRGDLVAYVGGASGDLATRMRRYAAHLARGRVTVLAVVA